MKKFLSLLGLLPAVVSAQTPTKPHGIILLVADDLGYGDLSCYGGTGAETPVVDSLASRGVRFTNMHACASTSTPSRYAMLTGKYPFRCAETNVANGDAGMIIKPEDTTLADLMHRAGYRTAAIGKWHLGLGSTSGKQDWNGQLDQTPADLGFDYHYIMAATSDRVPCVFIEQGKVANYDAAAPISVSYSSNFSGEPTGRDNPELLTKLRPSHGHDGSIVNGISRIGYMRGGGNALWRDEDIADSIVQHAIRFIDQATDEPFFIYLCTNDVHVPRMPHERFRGKNKMGLRGEAILQFDWTISQLTQALRERGLDENTLLLITSDNGPVLDDGYQDQAAKLVGEHKPAGPWRGWKYSAYEGGSAVPFILYWPKGVRRAVRQDALTSQIDLLATLSAAVGEQISSEIAKDSEQHLDTWLGKDFTPRGYAVSMTQNRSLTLRTQHFKLIEASNPAPAKITWGPDIETGYKTSPQLFNVKEEPYEEKDVSAALPDTLSVMLQLLRSIKSGTVSSGIATIKQLDESWNKSTDSTAYYDLQGRCCGACPTQRGAYLTANGSFVIR